MLSTKWGLFFACVHGAQCNSLKSNKYPAQAHICNGHMYVNCGPIFTVLSVFQGENCEILLLYSWRQRRSKQDYRDHLNLRGWQREVLGGRAQEVLLGGLGQVREHQQPSLLAHPGALEPRWQGRRGEPGNTRKWRLGVVMVCVAGVKAKFFGCVSRSKAFTLPKLCFRVNNIASCVG